MNKIIDIDREHSSKGIGIGLKYSENTDIENSQRILKSYST